MEIDIKFFVGVPVEPMLYLKRMLKQLHISTNNLHLGWTVNYISSSMIHVQMSSI